MDKSQIIDILKNINGIVAVSQFGSYGTEYWIKDRSDIDIAVVIGPNIPYMDTLTIEDKLLPIFQQYYGYDKIHLTFILFKDFASKFARIAVDSDNIFVIDENRWFDFYHYVLKYARNNREFERKLKIDEQYTYFGGIIDESIL
ncbi:nucleotidyltransferase domain-containing protein (plasmid) [Haloimpatiens sp. FM7330]|uniref:nucleotidyltransferase domain-containing protein n=1 Tax=Haloimpatiens sp. FM7330 TaxID=3298610 RepID=UPI003624EB53